jgi:hypothetical protein
MISADSVPVGGDSVGIWPPREGEMMDHINLKGQGGTFSAYIARPKTSPASAVVVLQELFGVNADIVFRPWKRAAPLGNLRLSIEGWDRESYTDDERDV